MPFMICTANLVAIATIFAVERADVKKNWSSCRMLMALDDNHIFSCLEIGDSPDDFF